MSLLSSGSIGTTRREFLRSALGAASFAGTGVARAARGKVLNFAPKTLIVTFGGGARDEETFAVEGQKNIPCLLEQLIPQGTFFTQVVNAGILGHYVATASILTGAYERFDNFIAQPPPNPTVFEYFRKGLRRPAKDAWVIAPSNGFQRIGASGNSQFGSAYGAGVILPKKMLEAAIGKGGSGQVSSRLLQDNFENPLYSSALSSQDTEVHLETLESILRISQADFVQHAQALDSADELSIFIAKRLMTNLSPSLLALTLHDMDIAHAGAYSLYVDAIQRADRLCGELWTAIQTNPEYKDRTTLLIMPDFGRDADDDPAGNGFQHHRTGGALARTTWLLALGPNIRHNETVDRRIESIDLVPTVGGLHGFDTPGAMGRRIQEIL